MCTYIIIFFFSYVKAPQSFKVLFNGCEVALKAEGVDAVKKPVKVCQNRIRNSDFYF